MCMFALLLCALLFGVISVLLSASLLLLIGCSVYLPVFSYCCRTPWVHVFCMSKACLGSKPLHGIAVLMRGCCIHIDVGNKCIAIATDILTKSD